MNRQKNRWQTLEKTGKYGYLRVFSINTAHGQSQLSQDKVRGTTQIYALPKINQNEFDTLTPWPPIQSITGFKLKSIQLFRVLQAVEFYNNERPQMSLNNMTPREAASCRGKIQKNWTWYREKYLESLEISERATTFAAQTLEILLF